MADHTIEHDAPVRHARDSDGNPPEQGLAKTLSELARELQAEPDLASLLPHIVRAVVHEIDGAEQAGISLVKGRRVQAIAPTAPIVERMDQLQDRLGEGPCLSSLREHITVRSNDFTTEDRWPSFVAAALTEGVRSMLSVQLFVEDDNLGALNLYSSSPQVFTSSDEFTAIALAAHAAVAMKGSQMVAHLTTALEARDVIGQGKGILMERYKIGADQAFRLLVLASQNSNVKLRDIADELAATGELRRR